MGATSFSLVKWYMDCVTDSGEAAIVYLADLHWRGIHARIGSVLTTNDRHSPVTSTSLGRYTLRSSPERITIEHSKLKIAGCWLSGAAAHQHKVYESSAGSVVWNCIQPRSRAKLSVEGREFAGLGYVECLNVTVPPLQLPLQELRWGRFVAPDHTLAWVDWKGTYSTSFALLDTRLTTLSSASDREVIADDAVLQMASGSSLRSGRLGATILPGALGLRRLFPRRLFGIDEQKSLSLGTLTIAGQSSTGWVIHEVVKWQL
jgi:hypothetical protein